MAKFFKIKKSPFFGDTFAQREFLTKNSGYVKVQGPPRPTPFKCQRYRADWSSNQKLLHQYQHARFSQSAQFIKSFVRYN